MRIIEIDDNFRITVDGVELILQEKIILGVDQPGRVLKRVKKENIGKEKWIIRGYFGTMKAAIERYFNLSIIKAENLRDMSKKIDEVRNLIQNTFNL